MQLKLKKSLFHKCYCILDSFTKVAWNVNDSSSILRGNVDVDRTGLNIKIKSEAYYFIYTKIQFKHKARDTYKYVILLM